MSNLPFLNTPFLYINGLQISNDATTPNTKFGINLGQCRDSTDVYQIALPSAVTVNSASTGLNGIDTGTLAVSTLYAVHVISDPVTGLPSGGLLSLSITAPLMPFGYSAFRHIGYIATDASAHFLLAYYVGNNNARLMMYDAPQATAITAGAATTYTDINISTLVPPVTNLPVWIASTLTPGAAGRQLFLQRHGATGDAVKITGQVSAVVVTSNSLVMSGLVTGAATIAYKVTNAGDAAAINVAGYQFFI